MIVVTGIVAAAGVVLLCGDERVQGGQQVQTSLARRHPPNVGPIREGQTSIGRAEPVGNVIGNHRHGSGNQGRAERRTPNSGVVIARIGRDQGLAGGCQLSEAPSPQLLNILRRSCLLVESTLKTPSMAAGYTVVRFPSLPGRRD